MESICIASPNLIDGTGKNVDRGPCSPIGPKTTFFKPLGVPLYDIVRKKVESKYRALPIALATVRCRIPSFQYLTL
jgi:hypothetical protein